MKLKELVVATGNGHKVEEIRSLLEGWGVSVRGLPPGAVLPPETGPDFFANALIKAEYGRELTGLPTLADDSGLEVEALGGAPGVRSARYAGPGGGDAANNAKLLQAMAGRENRRARFRSALVLVLEPGVTISAQGCCPGLIGTAPRGQGGFGYDPLFYLPQLKKTMAELSQEEKNSISHRGRALAQLVEAMKKGGLL